MLLNMITVYADSCYLLMRIIVFLYANYVVDWGKSTFNFANSLPFISELDLFPVTDAKY